MPRLLIGILGALSVVAALAPAPAHAARTLDLTDCRLPHPAGLGSVAARCGSLEVPEDRDTPGSRTLRLRIAIVPALDRRSEREPLFVIPGGPGQSATDFYAAYAGAFAPVQRTRDLVLVDQRGTGESNRLDCDFPDDYEFGAQTPDLLRRLSAECRQRLPGRPQFYTTSVAVRDLDAVRIALGYDRIDLYGVSYGTRVVQHYARRYAAHTRAVVLDGVVPPDLVLGTTTPFDAQRALDAMFARCAQDAPCERAFPDLARRFDRLRGELAVQPRRVVVANPATNVPQEVDFGAEQLTGAVRLLNYTAATTALLPMLIDRATKGDAGALASQLLLLGESLDSQLAYGMNAAVTCAEDAPGLATVDRGALAKTYFGSLQIDGLLAMCEGWPPGVVDADLKAPLSSAVPALLLSGEFDPVTPPSSGERAAKGFRDAKHVVVKGQGHGQLAVGCTPRVIAAFLEAGTARDLDVKCLDRAAPDPFFLDAAGPAP